MKIGNVKDLLEEKYKTFLKGILLKRIKAKIKQNEDVSIVSVILLKITGFVFANSEVNISTEKVIKGKGFLP